MYEINEARLKWDVEQSCPERFDSYWKKRQVEIIPRELFTSSRPTSLEIGAGSGGFLVRMAELYPEKNFIGLDRCRLRGQTLLGKAARAGHPNLAAFRGNAIPVLINGIPDETLERIYILYPCPWDRTAQRRNRWYLHPVMHHMVRILKPGGLIVWASDQKFYIDEARFVCEAKYPFKALVHGELAPNPYNDLAAFPQGRSKFESTFLSQGQRCFELVVQKNTALAQ